ncbi:NUDIX hydrolase domain-like protein [Gamsiella multidivaricata]|uniref:NUDIX hydrolase domain-like protein n=1 Tax=Gamsiella multidivaricata TaxID=101098 RepID=UPI0022202202|nr:NUDIX hydrolase domain-like protein [Gamsiella multidivaricata]KAG0368717.1 hypothetical protein BGZ54_001305 [Gamsiella multidivaricata]KAI7826539.1 NUDIX hydrolase domain-like protein [Gamsiella multidivaricata]
MYLNQKSVKALENLQNHPQSVDNYKAAKRSAVLVALLPNSEGDLEVILTVRASTLRTNAGDSAFPGGKVDPEDVDLIATAKREAFEEVRLATSESQTLTILTPVLSRHFQVVTPVVVYCPAMTTADLSLLYPNPGEVAAIFTVPLEYFLSPRPEDHKSFDMQWMIAEYRIHRFERCGSSNYILGEPDKTIKSDASTPSWPVYGMTAGVLIEVAKIAYQREPDFEPYSPNQVRDDSLMTEWYNRTHGLRSSI